MSRLDGAHSSRMRLSVAVLVTRSPGRGAGQQNGLSLQSLQSYVLSERSTDAFYPRWEESTPLTPSQRIYPYTSCRPPITSCMDGVCQGVEHLSSSLCPQDCSKGCKIKTFYKFMDLTFYITIYLSRLQVLHFLFPQQHFFI